MNRAMILNKIMIFNKEIKMNKIIKLNNKQFNKIHLMKILKQIRIMIIIMMIIIRMIIKMNKTNYKIKLINLKANKMKFNKKIKN